MTTIALKRSFLTFHLTLAIVVFIESVRTALHATGLYPMNPLGSHLAFLAELEAAAAILFVIPKTLKLGSWLLMAIFAIAIVVHGIEREMPLLVYAAGVVFVNAHGSVFSKELFNLLKTPV